MPESASGGKDFCCNLIKDEANVLGYQVLRGREAFLQIKASEVEADFNRRYKVLRVVGEGRIKVRFPFPLPEERKGFRALLLDLYGRPSKFEGGSWAGIRSFNLEPGNFVVISA